MYARLSVNFCTLIAKTFVWAVFERVCIGKAVFRTP